MRLYLGGMFACLTAFRQQPLFVERRPPPLFLKFCFSCFGSQLMLYKLQGWMGRRRGGKGWIVSAVQNI